ncbi:MAG TPA: 23S rRNA (pseudouridine(1915)-N(3))-methyltransferase RlmH [Acidobacteriaceae bacterium]|nr:23S rRNA (pseudouridine(1915)-N(3))-methyltransferase RlmH [Acidobacteriaceae bacterium]
MASVAVRGRSERFEALAAEYLERLTVYVEAESQVFKTADALLGWVDRLKGRTAPLLVLLDERGRQMSSATLSDWLRERRGEGRQRVIFAIGPADGWSREDRDHAGLLLSLGPMTLPHELARVVVSEQLYRAFTILAGHPYHRE